ncbi:GNAT family N-acetyltransferase [Paraburkholderia mimosarum]|uniref:GNAT family N-acetyltransferase n=1 Tax=Paraburkholderia mimosarum TaxID=312026 RepID=UPI0004279B14|nr:GNAT family N-acetyltransferase [Paraburkholderia mimosarum]
MTLLSTQASEPILASVRSMTSGHAPVMVRVLTSADRERLLAHFLALESDDRLLRFGQAAPDHVIEKYVRSMDFTRDTVFGVFDHQLQLVGVGHLAYLPADGNGRTAEFGVSVLESARGQGIGSKLFERAAIRSRNTHVTTLYMHCLSRNSTMMHIAKKSGMKIEYAYGEADAYLSLEPADQSSIIAEMLQEQAAVFDYALKRQARQASKFIETILPQAVAA